MAAKVVDGKVQAVWFDEQVPAFVLQPVAASHNKDWIVPLLGASILVLAIAALSWPLSAFIRWRYGRSFSHVGQRGLAYRLVRVVAAADVVFVRAMVSTLIGIAARTESVTGASDGTLRLLQLLGLGGLLGVVIGPWNIAEVWRDKASSWWAKLTAVLVTLAFFSVSYLAFAVHFLTASLSY